METAHELEAPFVPSVHLSVDGRPVECPPGSTVLEAIRHAGGYVPTLCHDPDLEPFGGCRLCLVKIEGVRGLPTACTTPVRDGMVVCTDDPELARIRRGVVALFLADHPLECTVCSKGPDCELLRVARYLGVEPADLAHLRRKEGTRPVDDTHPAMVRDPDKCILCGRCVRACREIQGVGAVDFAHRGYDTIVAAFAEGPLQETPCQTCGECVEHCPTGALSVRGSQPADRTIRTLCPYCGVGCSIDVGVRGRHISGVHGVRESPVNQGGLCVKGRFGLDFVHHPDRLTRPLMRIDGVPKVEGPASADAFRAVSWDAALDRVAASLGRIRAAHGPDAVAVLASAKGTNEDNYILQKFARATLGTNNVDHCARLCHASTVAAALDAFGDGAMSNSIADIDRAEAFLVIGSNTTECHPLIGRRILRAVRTRGARLIVVDPRATDLATKAHAHLAHRPGTDVALLNGIMRCLVVEGLWDESFARGRCEGLDPLLSSLEAYPADVVARITGVPPGALRTAARLFGKAGRAIVFYGMGITQHTTGTDNVKAVANLLMLTGNMGRPGTGFSPLRGQNNVQGACDLGALPNVFPGYQRVDDEATRTRFEQQWGRPLDSRPGLTLTDLFPAAAGRLRALYVVGENPLLSEPDLEHTRRALAQLDLLVVQDVFSTQTAQLADVVLPAACFAEKDGTFTSTERRVQRVRKVVDPPGEAREDWRIVADLSARMGYPMGYGSAREIMDEIARVTPIYGGVRYDRLDNGGLQWPCRTPDDPGTPILHEGRFTRGLGRFHVVHHHPPAEVQSPDYPLILTTGRVLEHWHTGTLSHRSRILEGLVSESSVEISRPDAARLGVEPGDVITLSSRRGKVRTRARPTDRVGPGLAFLAFHWSDAPANALTNPAVDPTARIPEYKVASVKAILTVLEKAAEDNRFLATLAEDPATVLRSFDLSPEERAALASGDIRTIEKWVGPLDARLKTWLKARLEQERW